MDVSESHIYEKSIEEKYSNVFRRTFLSVRWLLILQPIIFLFFGMIKGFTLLTLYSFIIVVTVLYLIYFLDNWKMMSKVVINHSTGMIDIFSFRGNKVYHELRAKSSDIQILIRQNFSYRTTVWGIAFFKRTKRKFYQAELNDWSKDVFLEIEKEWKKSKSTA